MASFWDRLYNTGNNAAKTVNNAVYGRPMDSAADWNGLVSGNQNSPGLFGLGVRQPGHVGVDPNAANIPGYEQDRARALGGAGGAQGRMGPQTGFANINQGPQDQFRQGQMDLVSALTAQAAGQGPSLAQGQLQQATDRNMAQAMALGRAQAGGQNAGLAMRQIQQAHAGMNQQAASDSALLRMNEQMQARNMLGQVLAGGRGQDIGLAAEQAGLQQQSMLANQNSALQMQGMNDAQQRFWEQLLAQQAQAQGANNMGMAGLQAQTGLANEGLQQGAYDEAARRRLMLTQMGSDIYGKAVQSGGAALAFLGTK